MSNEERWPRKLPSFDAADFDVRVLIWAVQAGSHGLLEYRPVHAEFLPQGQEIVLLEILPIIQRVHLFLPALAHRREHADDSTIFHSVGKARTLCDSAESVVVLAGQFHVVGVEHKVGVVRRVLPGPEESVCPGISR